ncbi:PepSY domain-containing protein [Sphingopyxis sp. PET50]|uniref:PepSY domain-containing protein n=1 Tax=Sphingopyxis sp. PET50 TaxID=2976533 RepID=UPI0021AEB142|nr:PepSY domain-containing protein [Sphingopyxis sp. PET50]
MSALKTRLRAQLLRIHIWLGWLVGVPLILWTLSGLIMVIKPIDEVRGSDLRSEPAAIPAALAAVPPRFDGRPVEKLELAMRKARPVWLIRYAGGDSRAADAATGALLPPVTAAEARGIADAAQKAPGRAVSVARFAADANPLDLRRDRPAWQVAYADGLHAYVDADTGELLALRTRWWRTYDVFWGLHIMDLQTREDTHHPLLTGFAAVSLVTVILGFAMLFVRQRRRRNGSPPASGRGEF